MSQYVHLSVEDGVATIVLDNPPLNIISAQMRPELVKAFEQVADDPQVRCVVLTGAGDRAFCAGADLGEEAELTAETVRQFIDADAELFERVENCPVPVIAAINGHCMGGGLELALSCDIRITADDARFCGAGVKVGLVVSTARLTRLVGFAAAKEVLLTGRTFEGRHADKLNLASAAVPRDQVRTEAQAWAREIASRAPLAVKRTKQAIHEAAALDFDEALSREFDHFAYLSTTEDHKHAIEAFFRREQPVFHGR